MSLSLVSVRRPIGTAMLFLAVVVVGFVSVSRLTVDLMPEVDMPRISISSTYEGRFKFILAEGESIRRPIPPTGNTNTHGIFQPDVRTFLKRWVAEGPTHHFALGIGSHAKTIQKIADILNIENAIVSED